MARAPSQWLRTDEYLDAAESLRAAAEFADDALHHTRAWKWLLIAAHSAVQGSFVVSLSSGSHLRALKRTSAHEWLKAYDAGGPWPSEIQLDYFLELYRKAKKHVIARPSTSFTCGREHDCSMRRLNDLRNGFIHFSPRGWSIEIAGLPHIVSACTDVTNYLLWDSGAVVWPTESLSRRAKSSASHLRKSLTKLKAAIDEA